MNMLVLTVLIGILGAEVFSLPAQNSTAESNSTSSSNSTVSAFASSKVKALFSAPVAYTSSSSIIAFSATKRNDYRTGSYAAAITYDYINTNYGSGLNSYTGHFAAPASGVYCFMASIQAQSTSYGYPSVSIVKNNVRYVSAKDYNYGGASNQVILYLYRNDHVWLQMEANSGTADSSSTYRYTSFSGFLIK